MKTWLLAPLTGVCIFIMNTSACWAAPQTLTVGFTISETGRLNADSKPQLRGIKLWRDQVNERGGIQIGDQRYKVKLKYYDDQSSPARVQQLYSRLILQDGADFLISPYSSGLTSIAAVVSEQFHKIMIATGAAQGHIFTLGNHFLFQVYTPSKTYFKNRSRHPPSARRYSRAARS